MILRDPHDAWKFVVDFTSLMNLDAHDATLRTKNMLASAQNFFVSNPCLFYRDIFGPYRGLGGYGDTVTNIVTDVHVFRQPNYDMCMKGRPEWDMLRFAASACLLSADSAESIIDDFVDAYVSAQACDCECEAVTEDTCVACETASGTVAPAVIAAYEQIAREHGLTGAASRVESHRDPSVRPDCNTCFVVNGLEFRKASPIPYEHSASGIVTYELMGKDIVARASAMGDTAFKCHAVIDGKPYIVRRHACHKREAHAVDWARVARRTGGFLACAHGTRDMRDCDIDALKASLLEFGAVYAQQVVADHKYCVLQNKKHGPVSLARESHDALHGSARDHQLCRAPLVGRALQPVQATHNTS